VKSTKKPKPRTCRKCGCTDLKACIEFDEKGRGFPCSWTAPAANLCSACVRGTSHLVDRAAPVVVAPQLAGAVARPR